jgi:Acyl-CoA synthetases (AMP-forming)/AMP-acid ligases II
MSLTCEPLTSTDLLLAGLRRDPDAIALHYGECSLTHRELLESVYRTAGALLARSLGRGDCVTLLGGARPETFITQYAARLIGCRTVFLYEKRGPADLTAMARSAGTTVFVVDPVRFTDVAAEIIPGLGPVQVLSLGTSPLGDDLLAEAEQQPAEPLEPRGCPSDVASIMFTGGSTGTPKGVPLLFALHANRQALQETHLGEPHRFLLCTGAVHVGGMLTTYTLITGGTVVMHETFDAGAVVEAIERHRITHLYVSPMLLYRVLDHPRLATADTSSLRLITYTGSPAAPERLAEAVRRFGPILCQWYGQIEAGLVSILTPEDHQRPELLPTAGRVLPFVEIEIRDPAGNVLPLGAAGEIFVRSPVVMPGYWQDPERTAEVLRDGWLRTGDLGRLDEDRYLTLLGRRRHMIIVNNDNVFPAEVEEPLLRHPDVRMAVVFGVTDADRQETVHAAVVTDPAATVTAEDLRDLVLRHKGPMYVPASILFLPEIPLTSPGKPDIEWLRALIHSG